MSCRATGEIQDLVRSRIKGRVEAKAVIGVSVEKASQHRVYSLELANLNNSGRLRGKGAVLVV